MCSNCFITHSSVKFPTMARERTSNGTVPVSMFSFNFLCKEESKVKTALKNNKHYSCVLLDYSTNRLRFRNYDIQEPQCFEVAKRGWNRAAECILFKFQFLKARQIAQWWRYRPCQVVLVQPPEEHQCINNLEIVRIQHCLIKSIWKIL